MKRNSTFVCKVLLTAITTLSLNFNTVRAQSVGHVSSYQPVSFATGTGRVPVAQYQFPSVAPGIDAFITVFNRSAETATQIGDEKSVNIKWITELEQNDGHFEVERSFDNNNFKTIAVVLDGFSTGITQKTFLFKDNSPEIKGKKMVYYRLKQLDPAGNGTSSKLLTVRLQPASDIVRLSVPNPFAETLYICFNTSKMGTTEMQLI